MINTSQQIGGALGTAIVTTVYVSRSNTLVKHGDTVQVALTSGFQRAFMINLGFAIVGLIATLLVIKRVALAAEGAPTTPGI